MKKTSKTNWTMIILGAGVLFVLAAFLLQRLEKKQPVFVEEPHEPEETEPEETEPEETQPADETKSETENINQGDDEQPH